MTKSNSFRTTQGQAVAPITVGDLGQTSQRRKDGGSDDWSDFGVGHVKSRKGPTCPTGTICLNCPHQTNGVCH